MPVARPALRRESAICFVAGEVLAGEAVRVGDDVGVGAGRDDLAAADAGAGAEIDEVVGRPHGVLVVLDDEDGVAHVAQPFEAAQQAVVVARVQADARLIEDVEDADQAAADLARQADALGLAAGKGRGGAVERQIMQADVEQEAEPAADFLEHFARRWCAGAASSSFPARPSPARASRPGRRAAWRTTSTSVLPPTRTARACGLSRWPWQAGAAADAHVLFELQPPRAGRRLLEAAQQLRDDAFPFAAVLPDAAAALLPLVGDVPVAAAVQQQVALFLRQVLPGRLQVDAERLGDAFVDVLAPAAHAAQRHRPAGSPRRRS